VRRRFVERYRLAVSADDLQRIVDCIRRGEAVLLREDPAGKRAVYAAPRPSRKGKTNKLAPVVYDRRFDAIVTVLPEHNLTPYRGAIKAFRQKRVAEMGEQAWPLRFPKDTFASHEDVKLALDSNRLFYHVLCASSICPFPVSIYVRDVHRWQRKIVYLKANGFSASCFGASLALLRQQFKTCLAVRTGIAPANTGELTDRFINKLARAIRRENLSWASLSERKAA
jgi:hypothetical protein